MVIPILLFILASGTLLVLIWLIWQFWWRYARISPEDEEFEERLADLNEHQANRVSDEELRRPTDIDQAWQTMVERGKAAPSPRRSRRRP